MRYAKHLSLSFLSVFTVLAALWAMAGPALAAYPPLAAPDGKPKTAAHALRLENGQVELALQVLAPGKTIEAVRIDNMGGIASLWRSDGKDNGAPLSVSQGGAGLTSGAEPMNLALDEAETLLTLSLKDNGAFAGKNTNFRVTVFFAGGERAMCALGAGDFPETVQPQARTAALASSAEASTYLYGKLYA